MKITKIIYYGTDSAAAKSQAAEWRSQGMGAFVRDAAVFNGEIEIGEPVILPCVSAVGAARIRAAYGVVTFPEAQEPARVVAEGRGRSARYYVKRGDEVLSGPYPSRPEAEQHIGD